MERRIDGLHHVTAIAGDPQSNIDFYSGVLGLRFIKETVNYDDPNTYHFYYGNGVGEPGTILTFFPWPGAQRGSRGTGQTTAVAFSVPRRSLGYWNDRLASHSVAEIIVEERFGQDVLTFTDPDGMAVELVEDDGDRHAPWAGGGVDEKNAIRGLHHVTLTEHEAERTASMLEYLGYSPFLREGQRSRFEIGPGGPAMYVDIVEAPQTPTGRIAVGSIHHIAFRTPDPKMQENWLLSLSEIRANVTAAQDRQYFHSIYFREPGGVLFEIATDVPGFLTDETPTTLGSGLKLPSWYEEYRDQITAALPKVSLPAQAASPPSAREPVSAGI
jgi:catechol 2,3-dioxygenase-like lactoylglutathione lyase family enzyme